MKRLAVGWIVLVGLARSAGAQAPGQTGSEIDPITAPFLEARVPEVLAARGILLSRLNLTLQLEPFGNKWLVSVIDSTTGRVAASNKIDALPADRDAAVTIVTDVVAGLTTQVTGRAEPPPPPPWTQPTAPPPPPPPPPGAGLHQSFGGERAQHDAAEAEFNRRSIRFGPTYDLRAAGNYTAMDRRWTTYQGDTRQRLRPFQFYQTVGRPDLIDSYSNRKMGAIAGFVIGGVAAGAAYVLLVVETTSSFDCSIRSDSSRTCDSDYAPSLLSAALSVTAFVVGIYYVTHLQPLDDAEAKALANDYNQRLRHQLGLPLASQRPRVRDIKLAPYVTGHEAGLALGARF